MPQPTTNIIVSIISSLKLTTYGKFSLLETPNTIIGYSYDECIGVVFKGEAEKGNNWLYPAHLSTLATKAHIERYKAIVLAKTGAAL